MAAAGGLPSTGELIERYATRSSRDLSAIQWYVALACFKPGIALEGMYARSLAGQAPEATGRRLHAMTLARAYPLVSRRAAPVE